MSLSLQLSGQDAISPLYKEIFAEELSAASIAKREADGQLEFRLISDDSETIGFAILHRRPTTLHVWMMGLRHGQRGRGLGGQTLDAIIDLAKAYGYSRVTLSTYNHRKEMLAASIRKGFRIVATEPGHHGDKVKVRLEYKILHKRELRIQLTGSCNFDCMFCHMEGVSTISSTHRDAETILALIKEALERGYDDITFTGGEPLLRKDDLLKIIAGIGRDATPHGHPDLTIVTNGYHLDAKVIQALAQYHGKKKLNISLHAADESTFRQIVRPRHQPDDNTFGRVLANIRQAVAAGLEVKLNCVMLKGCNTEEKQLLDYLTLAAELKVRAVKFLELIVLETNQEIFRHYYSADAICVALEKIGALQNGASKRVRHYALDRFSHLDIEVSQCTCKLGCANCATVRDRTFDPELAYFPCFGDNHRIASGTLAEMFSDGDRFIKAQAEKYGKDSPSLIRQDDFIPFRDEIFFFIPRTPKETEAVLARHGFAVTKQLSFTCWHYRPQAIAANASGWLDGTRNLKIGIEDHSPNIVEFIYSTRSLRQTEAYTLQRQHFLPLLKKPPRVNSRELAEGLLDALSFKLYLETRHEIREYANGTCRLSLDHVPGGCSIKVAYGMVNLAPIQRLLAELPAHCIQEPYNQWLEKRQKKSAAEIGPMK